MLRLLRLALLVILFFCILGLVISIGRPETGSFEDALLLAAVAALFAVAVPIRRIGTRPA
jgi:hypothetical protein